MQILELLLLSDNLKRTKRFYAGKLGLTVIEKKAGQLSFSVGRSVLTFEYSSEEQPVYHVAFNIPNNKLSEAMTWASLKFNLIAENDNNFIADFPSWNARSFYFYDNNGNVLELIARLDLNNASDQPFNSSSILAISEIGIVANNVVELAERLITDNKIPLFSKQPLLDNFAALGDDNGLLILSEKNRHWYPTDCIAEQFYTKIKLLNDKKVVEIVVPGKNNAKPV